MPGPRPQSIREAAASAPFVDVGAPPTVFASAFCSAVASPLHDSEDCLGCFHEGRGEGDNDCVWRLLPELSVHHRAEALELACDGLD